MDASLDKLIRKLARLPGLGPRSARRVVLYLLKNRERLMVPLAQDLFDAASHLRACAECGNLGHGDKCDICFGPQRDHSCICVVEGVSDLWAMERADVYRGVYHILGGTLSALDGRGPDDLHIDKLVRRANEGAAKEVILALSATVDGQTTAHYIADRLTSTNVEVTRLAHGVPIGGELDYLDDGTLAQAFKARAKLVS